MKFIVDAQLPKRLSLFLVEKGFDCIHTLDLPEKNATTDAEINRISLTEERVVISKDIDFYNRHILKLEPHKLLMISTGNVSNTVLLDLLAKNMEKIIEQLTYFSLVEVTDRSLITIL